MIEAAMLVVLGACLAGLVALAVLPAIWRRAVRLTRQAMEATSPMSHADVRAEISSLRATHALEHRRLESGLERLQSETAANRIARDRAETAANDLRKELLAREQALSEASAREDGLRREIQEHEEAVARAKARQRELERTLKHMTASAGDGTETATTAGAAPSPASDTGSDASVARASDLARIAGLESEVTSLKRKLEAAEQKARDTASQYTGTDTQAQAPETERRRFGQQNNRLFEAESKLIAAQAEITRLSILLEEAGQPAATRDDATQAPVETTQTLSRMTADAERLEAENARLRAELHSNDAFMSLRRELSDLAASVMTRLDTEAGGKEATAPQAADRLAADDAGSFAQPETAGTDDGQAPVSEGDAGKQSSLSARIRAARKRLKADGSSAESAQDTSSREEPSSKQKADA